MLFSRQIAHPPKWGRFTHQAPIEKQRATGKSPNPVWLGNRHWQEASIVNHHLNPDLCRNWACSVADFQFANRRLPAAADSGKKPENYQLPRCLREEQHPGEHRVSQHRKTRHPRAS